VGGFWAGAGEGIAMTRDLVGAAGGPAGAEETTIGGGKVEGLGAGAEAAPRRGDTSGLADARLSAGSAPLWSALGAGAVGALG
jgi:hypothetical protein